MSIRSLLVATGMPGTARRSAAPRRRAARRARAHVGLGLATSGGDLSHGLSFAGRVDRRVDERFEMPAGVPFEGVEELKLLMGDSGDHIDDDHGDRADAQVACDP